MLNNVFATEVCAIVMLAVLLVRMAVGYAMIKLLGRID